MYPRYFMPLPTLLPVLLIERGERMKLFSCAVFLLSLLFTGVVEAKEVVIPYDDFLKMLASKEQSDRLKNQCAAKEAIYVKLQDENKTVKKLNADLIQSLEDEVETRRRLGETQEQINEALENHLRDVTKMVEREKRLSRYKSEAFYLGAAIFLWVVN